MGITTINTIFAELTYLKVKSITQKRLIPLFVFQIIKAISENISN